MTKAMSKKELAKAYGVHKSTFMKWVKEIPDLRLVTNQRILTPKQVQQIFDRIGHPS